MDSKPTGTTMNVMDLNGTSYMIQGNTVGDIRAGVAQALEVSPSDVRLFRTGVQLSDDSATLAEMRATLDTCWHCVLRK